MGWIFFVFLPIGLSISIGSLIGMRHKNSDIGRKISISLVALIFLRGMQHENMQKETKWKK